MGRSRVCRRRVQAGAVRLPGSHGAGHVVVHFQDDALGPVFPMALLVLAFNKREGIQDVVDIGALNAIKLEISSIKFTP
jgi:hypothetical protein